MRRPLATSRQTGQTKDKDNCAAKQAAQKVGSKGVERGKRHRLFELALEIKGRCHYGGQSMLFHGRFASRLCRFAFFFSLFSAFFGMAVASEPPSGLLLASPKDQPVPPMLVEPIGGTAIPLQTLLQNKAQTHAFVLLHLWAPFCRPCQSEMLAIDAAWPSLQAQKIDVVAIAEDPDGTIAVPGFVRRYSLKNMPLYVDSDLRALKGLQAPGIPLTYLVTPNGSLRLLASNKLNWAHLTTAQLSQQ